MKIKLSSLKKTHLDEVYNLISKNISSFKPLNKNREKIFKSLIKQKNCFYIVASYSNKIIGFGSLLTVIKVRGSNQGLIEDIVVDKNYRRKKIGSLIINKLIKLAKIKKCYKVILQTEKRGLIFYKKLGFKEKKLSMQIYL